MSGSKYCKDKGLESLVELSILSNVNKRTLERMWLNNVEHFKILVDGALIKKYGISLDAQVYACRENK